MKGLHLLLGESLRCVCRWAVILARAVIYTVLQNQLWQQDLGYVPQLYEQIRWPLLVFQTAAILEVGVLHLDRLGL